MEESALFFWTTLKPRCSRDRQVFKKKNRMFFSMRLHVSMVSSSETRRQRDLRASQEPPTQSVHALFPAASVAQTRWRPDGAMSAVHMYSPAQRIFSRTV